jgi:hypothetical protein
LVRETGAMSSIFGTRSVCVATMTIPQTVVPDLIDQDV